ncbi:hypothetical protein [Phaeovulum sp.]|uniref:hypothetical protein n=1 Tax=Phaeovulum sp. TaxID=2934796 RepID=UPI00356673A2
MTATDAGTVAAILSDLAQECGCLPGVKALVVLGSVSRGEESYVILEGQRQLSSDIELLAVTSGWRTRTDLAAQILKAAATVEARHAPHCAPSFHIDVSMIAEHRLPFIDRRFIHFETRETGRVILGAPNLLQRIPLITPQTLNLSELHAVFIHRLASVLRVLEALKEGRSSADAAYLAVCRNGLDLLSVLLPHCGRLVAGYQRRQEVARDVLPGLAFEKLKTADAILAFTEQCLKHKLGAPLLADLPFDLLLEGFLAHVCEVRAFVSAQEKRPFFRRDQRRVLAAALKLKPDQLALEWRRGRTEAALADDLCAAIQGLRAGLLVAGSASFTPRLRALYPGAY